MGFPIYYQGKILFRKGRPAFSTKCCCLAQPCCYDAFNEIAPNLDLIGKVISDCADINGFEFDLPFTGEWDTNVSWDRDQSTPINIGDCVSFELLLRCEPTDDGVGDFFMGISNDSADTSVIRCAIVNDFSTPIIRARCSPDFFLEYDAGFYIATIDPEGTPCECCPEGAGVKFQFRLKNPP